MKILVVLLGGALAMGCMVEAGEGLEGEVVETSSEELKSGGYHGGGSELLLGNNPYGDCLNDCSIQKRKCEESRGPYDDLMYPCDTDYSICKARCDSAFPQ